MRKICAAALAAAFLLPVAGTAAAQDGTISIEGLVWFDRNEDGKTADEPGVPNEKIVKVVRDGSGELVGEYATGSDGRYSVRDLPAGRYVVSVEVAGRYAPTGHRSATTEGGTVDFGVRGGQLTGYSFLDQNRNGGMDADLGERPLEPGTLNGRKLELRPDGQFLVQDLPFGRYELVATDYRREGFALRDTQTSSGLDWVTGRRVYDVDADFSSAPIDVLYFNPKGDLTMGVPVVTPAKAVYTVGDEVGVDFRITNNGEAPDKADVLLSAWHAETLSFSDNLVGEDDTFTMKDPLLPGKSIDVKLRVKLTSTELPYVFPFVTPSRWGEDNFADNKQKLLIEVVEKGAETTAPTTSSPVQTSPAQSSAAQTSAVPATTTGPVAGKAGNGSGLASTGVSPLGFLGLGALLLAAGTTAFFVARRRRS